MRGDTNFTGSDSSDPTVYSLYCGSGARALIMGGGMYIHIYSGSARLVSFKIKLISKEIGRAEPEYMNIRPPISVLPPALCVVL